MVGVSCAESFVPVTKQTVCYIVCGLVFNDHGEVLMMQEAKSSCYGMWYLPAGRMETNETIQVRARHLLRHVVPARRPHGD